MGNQKLTQSTKITGTTKTTKTTKATKITSMSGAEDRFWNWIATHILWLATIVGTIIAIYIRFLLLDHHTGDMDVFLLPWYEQIKSHGGIRALSETVGNYNIPYQILIALMTYIPIDPLYGYKIISILCDFGMGGVSAGIAYRLTDRNKLVAVITYVVMICFPMVFMNSAMWGQCDSIYTLFCLLTFLFLLDRKNIGALIFFGIALGFKLQAVFLLPFLLCIYVKERRFSAWVFLVAPITMVVISLPAIVQGRSVIELFTVYQSQTAQYKIISSNYPSIWNLMLGNKEAEYYDMLKGVAIAITVLVLMLLFIWVIKQEKMSETRWLRVCFLLSYACVLFLPSMHERYDYMAVILGLVLTVVDIRTIPLFIGLSIINIKDYSAHLFGLDVNWYVLAIANVLVFTGYALLVLAEDKPRNQKVMRYK